MSDKSSIEWTDATWNPVFGCRKISPGCKHCYAEGIANRFHGSFEPRLVPGKLSEPLHWRKPRMVFVNSMSDLFGDFVPLDYIAAVFGIVAACPQHTFQFLTKRADRMRQAMDQIAEQAASANGGHGMTVAAYLLCMAQRATEDAALRRNMDRHLAQPRPLGNAWLGVSVEDRKYGIPRIEELRKTPAAVRFLSIEPLLEDIAPDLDLTGIDWVIVGGESGMSARPMHPEWVRRIRDKVMAARTTCHACMGQGHTVAVFAGRATNMGECQHCAGRGWNGPSFFFKQWGEWGPAPWRVEREPDEDVDAYKERAEKTCATHSYAFWASRHGWKPHKAGHAPWSLERTGLTESEQAPIRRMGKSRSGNLLDGIEYREYPRRTAS